MVTQHGARGDRLCRGTHLFTSAGDQGLASVTHVHCWGLSLFKRGFWTRKTGWQERKGEVHKRRRLIKITLIYMYGISGWNYSFYCILFYSIVNVVMYMYYILISFKIPSTSCEFNEAMLKIETKDWTCISLFYDKITSQTSSTNNIILRSLLVT